MNAVPSAGGYVLAFKLALTAVFPVATGLAYKTCLLWQLQHWHAGLLTALHMCVCAHAQVCAGTC